jgi:hypothetical protein
LRSLQSRLGNETHEVADQLVNDLVHALPQLSGTAFDSLLHRFDSLAIGPEEGQERSVFLFGERDRTQNENEKGAA